MIQKEQDVQKKFLDKLNRYGWAVKIINSNRNGCPDIVVCIQGRFVAIECKRKGKRAELLQKIQGERIKGNGGLHYVYDGETDVLLKILQDVELVIGMTE